MPPKGHALLSASSSDRWLHCPPSARLCETYEDNRVTIIKIFLAVYLISGITAAHISLLKPLCSPAKSQKQKRVFK